MAAPDRKLTMFAGTSQMLSVFVKKANIPTSTMVFRTPTAAKKWACRMVSPKRWRNGLTIIAHVLQRSGEIFGRRSNYLFNHEQRPAFAFFVKPAEILADHTK